MGLYRDNGKENGNYSDYIGVILGLYWGYIGDNGQENGGNVGVKYRVVWVVVKIVIPFWGTLNVRCRMIIGIQKGTIILTTTLVFFWAVEASRTIGLGV